MNVKKTISVLDFIISSEQHHISLCLECVAGRKGLGNKLTNALNRPGLALNGVFAQFGENRAHLFGLGEIQFLHDLEKENKLAKILEKFFSHKVGCCIVSHSSSQHKPPRLFVDLCEQHNCPLLYTTLSTYDFSVRLYRVLNRCFAPTELVHGVFMDIRDLGVLITGKSGVGKSESALGILERGFNKLIADDVVLLERIDESTVIGRSPDASHYKHHLEIRGMGIINLPQMFGINVMLKSKALNMIVNMEEWSPDYESNLDRIEREQFTSIMGVKIPYVSIPVKVGRNIPLLVETAVIKQRLKFMGYHEEDPFV